MRRVIFLLFLVPIAPLFAGDYTTAELLKAMEERNPALAEAGIVQSAAEAAYKREKNDLMDLMATYNLMDLKPAALGDFAAMSVHKLTLRQPLPLSGRLSAAGKSAAAEIAGAAFERDALRRELRLRLLSDVSLYRWRALRAANLTRQSDILQELLETARTRYVNGRLSFTNLNEWEIEAIEAENELLEVQRDMEQALSRIKEVSGIEDTDFGLEPFNPREEVAGPAVTGQEPVGELPAFEALYQNYQETSPERGAMQARVEAAQGEFERKRSAFFPDAGLMAEVSLRPSDGELSIGFGVEVALPIFSAVSKDAGAEQARQEALGREKALEGLDLRSRHRLERLASAYVASARQGQFLGERAAKLSEENILHMIREYQVEAADLEDVFRAVISSYELRNRYFRVREEAETTLWEIEALSGLDFSTVFDRRP